ncbi:hypothetical protein BSKO_03477 [Bryopsis sp. KO-2023]|nr:hypothetical protein BSKO_03477 [Bryopsis sp. KO-2023]
MLGWEGVYTILVLVLGLAALFKDAAGPDFVFMGMLGFLMVSGIITLADGLSGFSNSAPMTVAVLFVVAAGISETGGLDHVFGRLLGRPRSTASAMIRMMLPIAIVSAFMNNTPVVAIMIPIINTWSQKADLPPGQLFIPLSFASMLGGTCTLIGTSTNLVVAGQQEERGFGKPGFFDISKYGVPVAISGMIYMMIFAPLLLPGKSNERRSADSASNFMVGLQVPSHSQVVGKCVEAAGLRGLDGLFLASVRRGNLTLSAVGRDFVIQAHDILFFTGVIDNVQSLADAYDLRPITDEHEEELPALLGSPKRHAKSPRGDPFMDALNNQGASMSELDSRPSLRKASVAELNRLMQATVRPEGLIVGKSIRDIGFRRRFHAAIVAVSRGGQRIPGKLGDIVLQGGDVIVMDAGQEFDESSEDVEANLHHMGSAGSKSEREFMVAMEVAKGGPIENCSIEKAGLRGLPQLFLVEIERVTGQRIPAASPEEVLQGGDVLWFAGVLESVASLRKIPGLNPFGNQVNKLQQNKLERRLVQAVISPQSRLVGFTVKENQFRTRFHAAIIGVHRQGQRIKEKIGDIVLRGGDVLLLDTGSQFLSQNRNNRNFALVSEVENSSPPRFDRAVISTVILILMIASQLLGVAFSRDFVDLMTAALLAAGLMLLMQCLSGDAARSSIKWDVIITIAAAFGISTAMEKSHVAKEIADILVKGGEAMGGNFFVMVALYLATMLLSNLVANNAVAALMFPIAADIAQRNDISFERMSAVLMLAASSAFMSPFGYQTNLMVYGAGGYTIKDFVRFGFPMQLWQLVTSIVVIFTDEYWILIWGISALVGCVVASGSHLKGLLCGRFFPEYVEKRNKRKKSMESKRATLINSRHHQAGALELNKEQQPVLDDYKWSPLLKSQSVGKQVIEEVEASSSNENLPV